VVLQTNSSQVVAPYFQDEDRVFLNSRDITPQIIHGLATSLGGLESPLVRVPAESLVAQADFTWILGYHPFGPFTSSASISTAFTSAVIRNHIISRIHVSFDLIQEAMQKIDHFVSDHMEASTNSNLDSFLRFSALNSSVM